MKLYLLLLISFVKALSVKSHPLECDFKENFCDWNDPEVSGWNLGEYGEIEFGKPAKQIDNGGFIYARSPTKISVLESPVLDDEEPFCLYFNYFMFGSSVGSLELQLESMNGNSAEQSVWRQEGSKYDDWILGKYYFDPSKHVGDKFRLKFVATSDDISLSSILVKPGSCDFDYKCDFENPSLCFWIIEPDYKSNFRWFVSNGSSSQNDLVGFDASTHTATGHFMRTHAIGFGSSSKDIISTIYFSSNEAKCLSFQVFKQQFDSDLLQFAIESESGFRRAIWFQSYIVNQRWVKVNLDIPIQSNSFKLILSAHHNTEKSAPIALDELTVSPQVCSSLGSCNFDCGSCDYTIKTGELLVGFGRLPDPTAINWTPLKNIDPYDLFVYTNTPKNNNDSIVYSLESPYIEQTIGKTCLTFSYAFTFLRNGTFSIKLTSSDSLDSKSIWSLDPAVSEETWKTVRLSLPYADKFYKYSFEFSGVQLFAAIDDVVLDSCDKQQQEAPVCSYDGLINQDCIDIVPSAFNNWFFKKTSQLDNSLDPVYKFKNDLVLFFDQPAPAQSGSFSHFYVPNLKSDVSYCLKFWYLINGSIKFSLWTDKVDSDYDQNLSKTQIISLSPSGSSWAQAKITLDDIFEERKLIFSAGYVVNSRGTIAIDGLELSEGTCSFDYFCDFEDSCSWNNLGKDESFILSGVTYKPTTEWIKVDAKDSQPGRDATLGSKDGHFMALKSVHGNAVLTLPPFYLSKNTTEMCFSINVYTSTQCNIEIISEQGGLLKLIEQRSMDSMNWEPFQVAIKLNPYLPKVGRVYIVGSGDLAIDDASIKQGSCPGSSFTCENGKQISKLQVCDFIVDCPTGEDEFHCGSCYFLNDFCGYNHDDNAEWFSKDGMANVKSPNLGKQHTKLTSRTLRPTAPTCRLQFGYGHLPNDLTVLLVFQDGHAVEIWTNKMLVDWDKGTVEIKLGRIPIPFSIQFYTVLRNYLFVKDATSFGPVQLIDCGYQDTIDSSGSSDIYTCKNGKRISQDQLCDQSIDCFDGDDELNCDDYKIYSFEDSKDANDWTNLSNNNIKWSLVQASEQIISTPSRDHSKGLGNSGYMAIYPLNDYQNNFYSAKEVSLVGPRLSSDDNCSMVFYYNTAGVDLIVSAIDNNPNLHKLLEIPTDLVFGFKRARVNLRKGSITGSFRFVFTAKYSASIKLNHSQMGNPWARISDNYYAAVDDIVISGSCFH